MKTININATKNYNIFIGEDSLNFVTKVLPSQCTKVAIVVDENVNKLHKAIVEKMTFSLSNLLSKNNVFIFEVASGEGSKSIKTYEKLLSFLAENNFSRKDCLVALGGGVVGDLTGFVAATFLRGISFIQVPTTILAAVDSSVGGKTGINLAEGKNLVGAFKQPESVLICPKFFKTLPKTEILSGLGEIYKYAVLMGGRLFDIVKNTLTSIAEIDEEVLELCINYKKMIVEKDEFEKNERRLLNLGHSFAHAIEKISDFTIPHGFAVGVGTKIALQFSKNIGILNDLECEKLLNVLKDYSLNQYKNFDFSYNNLIKNMGNDKKTDGGGITLVLVEGIGSCVLKKFTFEEIKEILL